jgi:hypothetical protein
LAAPDPLADAARQAAADNEAGLRRYAQWDLEGAVNLFSQATQGDPTRPEYHLNLACAHARGGSYGEAMRSLGNYLHSETDETLAERYERLFSSALDEVESTLIEGAEMLAQPIQVTGKAIQMWFEYRLTYGRRPLQVSRPAVWAAALLYAALRVNLNELPADEVAAAYRVDETALQDKYWVLVEGLDLIPCDYRYFVGEDNPLDRLVEAAQALESAHWPSDDGQGDRGPQDGGPQDGGPQDGGPLDGGPQDGGPLDGGRGS